MNVLGGFQGSPIGVEPAAEERRRRHRGEQRDGGERHELGASEHVDDQGSGVDGPDVTAAIASALSTFRFHLARSEASR